MASVPLVDLAAQHRALRAGIDAAIARVIDASAFILGPELEAFERDFAAYLGCRHAIGVSNGTDALVLALQALGIGPGDEVIVPSWSFVATAAAVRLAGATPVLADIDPDTFHLDPASAAERVTPRTRAIVPVHLYGQTVDLAPFHDLARRHDLRLVEDACQAHGAIVPGPDRLRAGAAGDAGCFSFYPSKNLGALGDGGLVATRDDATAARLRRLRNHGGTGKYQHDEPGQNMRLDALQAAVLGVKLPHLDRWNEARRERAARLGEALAGLPLVLPRPAGARDHVYHVYVVRTERRDALHAHLGRAGIGSAIHYPAAIHQLPAFAGIAPKPGALPHSEAAARDVLSLPLFPELDDARLERVAAAVRAFFAG